MRNLAGIFLVLISLPIIGFFILIISWPQGSIDPVEIFPILGNILMLLIAALYSFYLGNGNNPKKGSKLVFYAITIIFIANLLALFYTAYPFRAGAVLEVIIQYAIASLVIFVITSFTVYPKIDN